MENLKKAYDILFNHKNEMENFMNHYVFKKMHRDKETFLHKKEDFLLFIKFCLNTAQMVKKDNVKNGLEYFDKNYKNIIELLEKNDIESLKHKVYNSPGMGQKIGSMLLEFIFMYSDKKNDELAKKLYLPLDTHVIRLLKESFNIKNIPEKEYELKIYSNKFINFQNTLKNYTNNRPIIYFDYLWFIGKMFCNKVIENDERSRGYKLCNYCWIKDCCENKNKWL